jgi:hypothetical protein
MRKRGIKWFFTNYSWNIVQTLIHKFWVMYYIIKFCAKLVWRGVVHDLSKFGNKESLLFADVIFDLKRLTYGTPEYKESLDKIRPCIDHHYSVNSHHPEYYAGGFSMMSALDRIEMAADWCAAVRRHKNGDIGKSIEFNQQRFKYSEDDKAWIAGLVQSMSGIKRLSPKPDEKV